MDGERITEGVTYKLRLSEEEMRIIVASMASMTRGQAAADRIDFDRGQRLWRALRDLEDDGGF